MLKEAMKEPNLVKRAALNTQSDIGLTAWF